MPVDYQHPDYTNSKNKWDRCNIVAAGQDAVHEAGTTLLPRLSEQTDPEYQSYKLRTPFYNATWRTIVGLQGMLFRKPPTVVVPPIVKEMLEDVTRSGQNLYIFALGVAEEALKIGRLGIFCDFPTVSEEATLADARAAKVRPMLRMYKAGSILNWKTRTIDNATVLSMVVLEESRNEAVDEFSDAVVKQYRVLDLVDVEVDGVVKPQYRVRVFEVKEEGGQKVDVLIQGPFWPKADGEHLERIPFQFVGVDDTHWDVDEPPLIDLIDINVSHYRVSADYEHGCHFTGLPTPVISGYEPQKDENGGITDKFCIGSTTAWVFPREGATATFLEFTGQGLQALEKNLERKERLMAVLGARMLEPQAKGVEATETVAIHHGGEQSMLSSVAQAISIGMTGILKVFTRFAGGDDKDVKYELNRDFFPIPMDALKLTALIAGWQNSAYSYETLFENLQKAEFVALDKTPEKEQAEIKANPPALPPGKVPTTTGDSVKDGPASAQAAATGTGKDPSITQLQNGTGGT